MSVTDISFPNLGIFLTDVPQSFSVFGFRIYLYSICIALGMAAGFFTSLQIAKRTGQDKEIYWDFTFRAIIVSVICARIYYVIFRWDDFKGNLLSVFALREGGLAIYGGVIGAFIRIFLFARRRKIDPLLIGDTGVPCLILGQAIGRWGNFFNREVFGGYSDGLLAMRLPIGAVRSEDISADLAAHIGAGENFIQVHPTFLYEMLWNLAIFLLLLLLWKFKTFNGEVILGYLGGYGLGRAFIEGIRTDTLFIPGTVIKVSQALAIVLVIFSIGTEIVTRVRLSRGWKPKYEVVRMGKPNETESSKETPEEDPEDNGEQQQS
ncbi:MAG: prolipoprotein diacylglyceryl transferase [Lachnospiraceae bacterium]|nr:prolipoprotein diacylglyceryl transferase [Lachnospiraceae bacterium]